MSKVARARRRDVGEFEEMDEIDLTPSREGMSPGQMRKSKRMRMAAEEGRIRVSKRPRWKKQLSQVKGWDERRRKP